MRISLKKFIFGLITLQMIIAPFEQLPQLTRAADTTTTSKSLGDEKIGEEEPTRYTPTQEFTKGESITSILDQAQREARDLVSLVDVNHKINYLQGIDKDAVAKIGEVAAKIQSLADQQAVATDQAVIDDLETQKGKVLKDYEATSPPSFHRPLFEMLNLLTSDPDLAFLETDSGDDLAPGATDHEYLEVSRLIDPTNSEEATEGSDNSLLPELTGRSAHNRDGVQAADISALDYTRCTQLSVDTKGKIKDRQKLPATPISFHSQASPIDQNSATGLQDVQNGRFGDPGQMIGTITGGGDVQGLTTNDFLRSIGFNQMSGQISDLLAGKIPNLADLIQQNPWNQTTGGGDLSNLVQTFAEGTFVSQIDGSGSSALTLGPGLDQTVLRTGQTALSQALPGIPPWALQGNTIGDVTENIGRVILAQRLLGPKFVLSGNTTREVMLNLSSQYLTGEVLGLDPTSDLRQFPLSNDTDMRRAIGKVILHQTLGISVSALKEADLKKTLGSQFDLVFGKIDPAFERSVLLLPGGSTNQFLSGGQTLDQFAEVLGKARIDYRLGAYGSNSYTKNLAFKLALQFGEQDLFVPTNTQVYPTVQDELNQILDLYGSLLSDGDRAFLNDTYPSRNLDSQNTFATETGVRQWLAEHLTNQPDVLGQILSEPNDDHFLAVGRFLFANAYLAPMQKLALIHFLEKGEELTLPIADTTGRFAVADLNDIDQRLGLLPGDFANWILKDQISPIARRVGTDLLVEATGNKPQGDAAISGMTRAVFRTDESLAPLKQNLLSTIDSLKLAKASQGTIEGLKKQLTDLSVSGLVDTAQASRDTQIDEKLRGIGNQVQALAKLASPAQASQMLSQLTSLVAGRALSDLSTLTVNLAGPASRNLGVTAASVEQMLRGQLSPTDLLRQVGANYLTKVAWQLHGTTGSADLIAASANPTPEALSTFFARYKDDFNTMAKNYSTQIQQVFGTLGDQIKNFNGEQMFRTFMGNQAEVMVGQFDQILHKTISGSAGSLLGGNGDAVAQALGLRVFMENGKLTGSFTPDKNFFTQLPKTVLADKFGIIVPDTGDAGDFLKANGKFILKSVGAPAELIANFDPNNPGKTLETLKDPGFWRNRPEVVSGLNGTFGNILGPIMGDTLQDIFTKNAKPTNLLDRVTDHLDEFFPGLPVNPKTLFNAIKNKDEVALTGTLRDLGNHVLGDQFGPLFDAFTDPLGSNKTMLSASLKALPGFLGNSPEASAVASVLTDYFVDGKQDQKSLYAAAGKLGEAFGIPFAADAAKIAADPQGFGAALVSSKISSQLAAAGIPTNYSDVRIALFGVDEATKQAKADEILKELQTPGTVNDSLSLEDKEILLRQRLDTATSTIRQETQKNLEYNMVDAGLKAPAGFTKTMLAGDGDKQLDALIGFAQSRGDISPEAAAAIQLIRSGDLNKVADVGFAAADAQISKVTGLPVPAGFSRQLGDLATGKIDFKEFQKNTGNFATAAAGQALDKALGMPAGTSQFINQGIQAVSGAAAEVQKAQGFVNNLQALEKSGTPVSLTDKFLVQSTLDKAKLAQANLNANIAGTVVSMVFGKELASADRSLGLPSGTTSLLVGTAIKSLFIPGSHFIALLGGALPMFAIGLAVATVLSGTDFLGGGETQKVVVCSPGGFYPYIKKDDLKTSLQAVGGGFGAPIATGLGIGTAPVFKDKFFDPNTSKDSMEKINLEHPAEGRLKPAEVAKALSLSFGYPGESLTMGEKPDPKDTACRSDLTVQDAGNKEKQNLLDAYGCAQTKAARWKIRSLAGDVLAMLPKTNVEEIRPTQTVLYSIPQKDRETVDSTNPCKNNWNYYQFFTSGFSSEVLDLAEGDETTVPLCTEDRQFVKTNPDTAEEVGILDWNDVDGGYGTFTAGSMIDAQIFGNGSFNKGLFLDPAASFLQSVHIGY